MCLSGNVLESGFNIKKDKTAAASKALIIYLSKMANKGSKETVDFRFLDSLILGGANINVTDKHGQTAMHEIARNWNTDVAKFLIDLGANVNQADKWGRSPLHLASAVDHFEMVKYLIDNGGIIVAIYCFFFFIEMLSDFKLFLWYFFFNI